jgi:hypothetical protein
MINHLASCVKRERRINRRTLEIVHDPRGKAYETHIVESTCACCGASERSEMLPYLLADIFSIPAG